MYRAVEVSVHRACRERAIIAILSVGGGKQLSERLGRPLYIVSFQIVGFPGVRGQTTILRGKNHIHSSTTRNNHFPEKNLLAGSHSLFPRWGRGTVIRAGGNTTI